MNDAPDQNSTIPAGLRGKHFVFLLGELGDLGGAERQSLILATLLRDRANARVSFVGWEVSDGIMTRALRAAGIPVVSYPLRWNDPVSGIGGKVARLARLIPFARFLRNTVRPDFLLPYMTHNSKIAALIWRRAGASYAWWNQRDEGMHLRGSRLERWLIGRSTDVVALSPAAKQMLVERCGVPESRIRISNAAVLIPSDADAAQWRARLGLTPNDRLLLMSANLTRYKDHETLLRALPMVRLPEGNERIIRLALAGRLDERADYLQRLAEQLGVADRVDFLGAVEEMPSLYAAADLVVHSSVSEGTSNAVLEAMAGRKAVVATDIPGLHFALGPKNADHVFAAIRDPDSLASRISALLSDDDLRRRIGEANFERAKTHFSPERLLEDTLDGITARLNVS
jgi:glycosyltransferase involved in cell wall biosynthesis